MNSCWEILGLEPTSDQKVIRRKYAELIKIYRPEINPIEFRNIREAYEFALINAKKATVAVEEMPTIVDVLEEQQDGRNMAEGLVIIELDIILNKFQALYFDEVRKNEINEWRALLIEYKIEIDQQTLNFTYDLFCFLLQQEYVKNHTATLNMAVFVLLFDVLMPDCAVGFLLHNFNNTTVNELVKKAEEYRLELRKQNIKLGEKNYYDVDLQIKAEDVLAGEIIPFLHHSKEDLLNRLQGVEQKYCFVQDITLKRIFRNTMLQYLMDQYEKSDFCIADDVAGMFFDYFKFASDRKQLTKIFQKDGYDPRSVNSAIELLFKAQLRTQGYKTEAQQKRARVFIKINKFISPVWFVFALILFSPLMYAAENKIIPLVGFSCFISTGQIENMWHRVIIRIGIFFLCLTLFLQHTGDQITASYKDEQKVFTKYEQMKKSLDQGDVKAQYKLGLVYYYGEQEISKNYTKAMEWFKKAAAQGHVKAQNILGTMYYIGQGVDIDYVKAKEWLKKAAIQGHMGAQNDMGTFYQDGLGGPKDYVKALFWYKKSITQGCAEAQYNLGIMYYRGQGLPKSYVKAKELFEKAAAQGMIDAQDMLGLMYQKGQGIIKRNYTKAFEWYQKAAAQGNVHAQYTLGIMCYRGYGVPEDYAKAKEWFEKAAAQLAEL